MKIYSIAWLLFISTLGFSQKNTALISWSSAQKIEWQDFKAKPNRASSFKALTASAVSFGINYENTTLTIEIKNEFNPQKSWTKVNEEGNLLNHERLHFDISELFARRLRKKILTRQFKSRGKKLMNEIADLYEETMKELAKHQRAYDKETNHSTIEDAQIKWETKVKKELEKLDEYTETTIQLELD